MVRWASRRVAAGRGAGVVPFLKGGEGEVQFRSAAYLRRHKFAPNDDAPSS